MTQKKNEEAAAPAQSLGTRTTEFLRGVKGEARAVTWPAWKDTRLATVVVIGFVGISSLFLGGVDFLLSKIIEWVVR
ncbi:MAG: preprotein translocase subunit SecE [Bdellovibrionota bacterium]